MNNADYKTIIETGNEDPEWDVFLSALEFSHYEQSTCWAKVKREQGWKAIRVKVFKGSTWLAGAQILCKRLPVGGYIGYIPSGPFYKIPDDTALDILIQSINDLAKKEKIQYIAVTPYVENAYLDQLLVKHGYGPTKELLPPTTTARATLIFDLEKDLDALMLDMRNETRRQIRFATKSGFTIREGNKVDLETLFEFMSVVAKKRNETPTPGSAQIFRNVWDHFHSKGFTNLLVLELHGQPIAMALIFTFGNTVRFWKVGWSGCEIKKFPTQLLCWELIKWSKINGFRYFDNVQVDAAVTDHIELGLPVTDELKSRRLYGTTIFKLSFGGDVLKFSGPWFRFQNPFIRMLYKQFGPTMMTMQFAKKIISRLS